MKVAWAVLILCVGCGAGTNAGAGAGPPRCGDGLRQSGEECDLGAKNGPNAGCERDCTLSCVPSDPRRGDAHCDPHDACKGRGSCGSDFRCTLSGALPSGADCGGGNICRNGACQAPVCGDGIVTAPEECDDGSNDGTRGCDAHCRFACLSSDSTRSCAPADPCQGSSTCNDATHTCAARTPLADGTPCGSARVCRQSQCLPDLCGNGTLDPGEQCDPPNGTTCDTNCQNVVCGDGVRSGSEQCDDGNRTNLDGCDSSCRFEQEQRATAVQMVWGTDAFCTANALGSAIPNSTAQSTLQSEINSAVAAGSMTLAFQVLGLVDLTGTNATGIKLGAVTGSPAAAPPLHHYDGTHDLDWWYAPQASDLDSNRLPVAQLPASISSKTLTAGPGHMKLTFVLGGGPVQFAGSNVRLRASVGDATAPAESTAATPGHTPAEHLDRALTSFASLVNGELCGNLSAASLAAAPVPASLQTGSTACDEGYTSANDMLDVLVRGCSTTFGFVTIIAPTQPDKVDASMPAAGGGGPYQLVTSGGKVSACKDVKGAAAPLVACLNAAAYSSALTFAAGRVIFK